MKQRLLFIVGSLLFRKLMPVVMVLSDLIFIVALLNHLQIILQVTVVTRILIVLVYAFCGKLSWIWTILVPLGGFASLLTVPTVLNMLEQLHLSSADIQKSYILKGSIANVLPKDWRADLQDKRRQWLVKQKKSKLWVEIMTGFCLLGMLKAYFQIKVENKWLFKRKQG